MSDLFTVYFHELTDGIPMYVYEALLSLFCLAGVLILTFYGVKKGWRKLILTLLMEYSFLLYCSTVIFRQAKIERGIELQPFWSYEAILDGVDTMIPETVMNVVVFIPIGLMMGLVFKGANWWKILMAGAGMSVSIELLQLLFKKGCCETDDVIHNTMGCAMGFGLYRLAGFIATKIKTAKCIAQR